MRSSAPAPALRGQSLLSLVRGGARSWPVFETPTSLAPEGEESYSHRDGQCSRDSLALYALVCAESHSQLVVPAPAPEIPRVPMERKCFTLEGRVTSMVHTSDDHVIAAFASGSIRFFDSASTDPAKRGGQIVSTIKSAEGHKGKLKITLQLPRFGGKDTLVFAGALDGSTKLQIIDIATFVSLSKSAGGVLIDVPVEEFSKNPSCRGLGSVVCTGTDMSEGVRISVFRAICGEGTQTCTIWKVTVRNAKAELEKLHTFTTFKPSLKFGCFLPGDGVLLQSGDMRERDTAHRVEIDSEQRTILANMGELRAASADGSVVFSGTEDLVVSTFASHSREPISTSTLQLSVVAPERKRSRHKTEVLSVRCSSDGKVAVVFTSDFSMLLYRANSALTKLHEMPSLLRGECAISTRVSGSLTPSPADTLLSVGWWTLAMPGDGGTMLLTPIMAEDGSLLPLPCLPRNGDAPAAGAMCMLCGDPELSHWDDAGSDVEDEYEAQGGGVIVIEDDDPVALPQRSALQCMTALQVDSRFARDMREMALKKAKMEEMTAKLAAREDNAAAAVASSEI